ncbi:GPI inositol-deacylase [Trichoplax sp. H2]|nr:GPI inositol-deacylase [Trichoplax sp. H2]|eukprot:RDD43927.1 GPI inositol-deacylase [Trichoplax sp. H2]
MGLYESYGSNLLSYTTLRVNTKTLRNDHIFGIPILFIPGNAGSYKQVRSLASISYQKSMNRKEHFNYYTIDLNEEISGLYGGTLRDQAEYVNYCIKRILAGYRNLPSPPRSVVVIGHSIGGMIARALFTLPNFDNSTVTTVITIATPHRSPVFYADKYVADFYDTVNTFWQEQSSSGQILDQVIIASVGGGLRDVIVRSDLTSLASVANYNRSINAITTAVPRTWLTIDHRCIVWCKELVLAIVRALYDMIEAHGQISSSTSKRRNVLAHHLIKHNGMRNYPYKLGKKFLKIDQERPVNICISRIWSNGLHRKQSSKRCLMAFPLKPQRIAKDRLLLMTTSNANAWIISCNGIDYHKCDSPSDLLNHVQIIPHATGTLKLLDVNINSELSQATHVMVSTATHDSVFAEFYRDAVKTKHIRLPSIVGFTAVDSDDNDQYILNYNLPDMRQIWEAYYVQINSSDRCLRHTTIQFHAPWFHEDVFRYVRPEDNGKLNFSIYMQTPRPNDNKYQNMSIRLTIWSTNAKCRYKIIVTTDYTRLLGQMVRYYAIFLPGWTMAIIILLAFNLVKYVNETYQSKSTDSQDGKERLNTSPGVALALKQQTSDHFSIKTLLNQELDRRWKFAASLVSFSYLFSSTFSKFAWPFPIFPQPDIFNVMKSGEWSTYLLSVIHMFSISGLHFQFCIMDWLVYGVASVLRFTSRWLSMARLTGNIFTAICFNLYFNIIFGLLVITICLTMCGALGLYCTILYCYVKLVAIINSRQNKEREYCGSSDLCFLLLNSSLLSSFLTIPSAIMWFKNLRYGFNVMPDPFMHESLLASCGLLVLFQKSSFYEDM